MPAVQKSQGYLVRLAEGHIDVVQVGEKLHHLDSQQQVGCVPENGLQRNSQPNIG